MNLLIIFGTYTNCLTINSLTIKYISFTTRTILSTRNINLIIISSNVFFLDLIKKLLIKLKVFLNVNILNFIRTLRILLFFSLLKFLFHPHNNKFCLIFLFVTSFISFKNMLGNIQFRMTIRTLLLINTIS